MLLIGVEAGPNRADTCSFGIPLARQNSRLWLLGGRDRPRVVDPWHAWRRPTQRESSLRQVFSCPCLLTRTPALSNIPQVLTFFTAFFLCATHAITCSCVEERILISREDDDGKEAGGPMHAIGEIWTTIKTLPRPIRQVFHVQVCLGATTSVLECPR